MTDPAALAAELRATVTRLKRRLFQEAGPGEHSPSQIAVLIRLERAGPMTASALARAETMRPQSMAAIIAPLEAANMLTGAPDPQDGRQTLLSLTPNCITWIREGRAARQDFLTRAIGANFSPGEQAQLAAALELLKRITG